MLGLKNVIRTRLNRGGEGGIKLYNCIILPRDSVHESPHGEGAHSRPYEGEGEDGADVPEEILLLHGVAGVKDNWGKEDVEENLRVESSFHVYLALGCLGNLALYLVYPCLK